MYTTYTTEWGDSTVCVSADWSDASCPIDGLDGRQVADFGHDAIEALRAAITEHAVADGSGIDEEAIEEAVEAATKTYEDDEDDEDLGVEEVW